MESLVKNAADEGQVQAASKKEGFKRRQEIDDIQTVLSIQAGRRLLWRIIEHCKVFESIWNGSALIHYNSGKQDVGHFLLGEITEAKPEALLEMMGSKLKENDNG
jgi:hypothetical protein